MLKESTYKEKFAMLNSWMPTIIEAVKKDLKNEHLKKDWVFLKKYLGSKNPNKLTTEELVDAYSKAIAEEENAEELGEFISNRWLMKNTEIYHFFEQSLSKINPNFAEIEELTKDQSLAIMEKGNGQFGPVDVYLFAMMNSVVFPKEIFETLGKQAKEAHQHQKSQKQALEEKMSVEAMQSSYEQQLARLTDKYEKKLLGLERKYFHDVEGLKKQISALQRKLAAK